MPRPRSYRSEVVVLKSAPIGEAGLIVTLYSRDAGKLRAVARGARKPSGKMVGHLEPLNKVELAVVRSRSGGLDTITQAQIVELFTSLKGNLEGISRGIYVAELVDGFGAEGSPNGELYSLLVDTLRFLDDLGNGELALRYFELQLLKCSGFMPELYRCVECRKELSPGNHLFSPEAGGTLCPDCTPAARIMRLSVQALKVMRFLDRGFAAGDFKAPGHYGTGRRGQGASVGRAEILVGSRDPFQHVFGAPEARLHSRSVRGRCSGSPSILR